MPTKNYIDVTTTSINF